MFRSYQTWHGYLHDERSAKWLSIGANKLVTGVAVSMEIANLAVARTQSFVGDCHSSCSEALKGVALLDDADEISCKSREKARRWQA